MKLRIAAWACAGALVVLVWSLFAAFQNLSAAGGIGWTFVCLTCPIALAHHHALGLSSVLLANAATYALIGTLVETVRIRHQPPTIAH